MSIRNFTCTICSSLYFSYLFMIWKSNTFSINSNCFSAQMNLSKEKNYFYSCRRKYSYKSKWFYNSSKFLMSVDALVTSFFLSVHLLKISSANLCFLSDLPLTLKSILIIIMVKLLLEFYVLASLP